MNTKLLIVDDDEDIRSQMKWALAKDYAVLLAEDRAGALELFREHRPMVVLLDLGLPPSPSTPDEGLAILAELIEVDPLAKVIVLSGQAEKDNSLRAIGMGAYDFLCKPAEIKELQVILKRAFHVARLEREYRDIQQSLTHDSFEGMLGTSPEMQDLFTKIRKVATTDAPVLILGESGTGKEMAAVAIHRLSARKHGPFVAINCSAIPETLLESELFGYEKGAFTGAHAQRKGRIESAAGGTLFLDEIGELPALLQVKLLRFLQEHQIDRVGGRTSIEIDTRVIAATNVDLKSAMAAGTFREDLYYRLAVVVALLPPLRQRSDDIPLLAKAMLRRFATQNGKECDFSPQALGALQRHDWPGNVRELENRIKRAVVMAEGRRVTPADLELKSNTGAATACTLKEAREAAERDVIRNALHRHRGKIAPAAAELGISRPTLYELMEKLGIQKGKTADN